MNNNNQDMWAKWKLSNMDDEHYYRMGSQSETKKKGITSRVFSAIGKLVSPKSQRQETNHALRYQNNGQKTTGAD